MDEWMDVKVAHTCFWLNLGLVYVFGLLNVCNFCTSYAIGDNMRVYNSVACNNVKTLLTGIFIPSTTSSLKNCKILKIISHA